MTDRLTTEELHNLKAMSKAATQGPWEVEDHTRHGNYWLVVAVGEKRFGWAHDTAFDDGSACGEGAETCSVENRDLMIAMRNAIDRLVDELLERRREEAVAGQSLMRVLARVGAKLGDEAEVARLVEGIKAKQQETDA